MSAIPAHRIALVTEDRATRIARKNWQGRQVSPATMEMVALHIRKTQLGFAIVAVTMASAMSAFAFAAPFIFGAN